jgi:hypothetical protein
MPIDERWDRLSDDDWSRFARDRTRQLRHGEKEGERDWGQSVVMMNFTARPEQQWKFILAAVEHAESRDELKHIAAGPIEHILGRHGEDWIAEAEAEAANSPKFADAMIGVWRNRMSDKVWARVQAIQQRAASHEPPDFA